MKECFLRLWKSGKAFVDDQNGQGLKRSYAGRIISTLRFVVVIICLGLWIGAFGLVKGFLFTQTPSGNVLTDLTCLTFFGGLVVAVFVGALVGNILQRVFWNNLTRRKK